MELLHPKGGVKRTMHTMLGTLGQLFINFDAPIARTLGSDRIRARDEGSCQAEVFDNAIGEWIPMTPELFEAIPRTYTFAPQPDSVLMELDYFVRGAGLLKHAFVWATNSIPAETYCMVRCDTNKKFRGRYTVTPWLPSIHNLGQNIGGDYFISDEDWDVIF